MVKNPLANSGDVRDAGLISGSGRSPGGGRGNPLQYSCLENPMIGGLTGYSPWSPKESNLNFFFKSTGREKVMKVP